MSQSSSPAAGSRSRGGIDPNQKPALAAITVGLSLFVGVMQLFVMIMAFAVAGRQHHPHSGVGVNWSNGTAMALSYAIGIVSILNSLVAFRNGRLHPIVTAVCTIVFLVSALMVNLLFVRAW